MKEKEIWLAIANAEIAVGVGDAAWLRVKDDCDAYIESVGLCCLLRMLTETMEQEQLMQEKIFSQHPPHLYGYCWSNDIDGAKARKAFALKCANELP